MKRIILSLRYKPTIQSCSTYPKTPSFISKATMTMKFATFASDLAKSTSKMIKLANDKTKKKSSKHSLNKILSEIFQTKNCLSEQGNFNGQ